MKAALPFDLPLPFFVAVCWYRYSLFPPPEREGKARLNKNTNTFYLNVAQCIQIICYRILISHFLGETATKYKLVDYMLRPYAQQSAKRIGEVR